MSCCAKPAIQKMDYLYPIFSSKEEQKIKINRVCTHCFTHWFGDVESPKQYTRKEWDDYINQPEAA